MVELEQGCQPIPLLTTTVHLLTPLLLLVEKKKNDPHDFFVHQGFTLPRDVIRTCSLMRTHQDLPHNAAK